MSPQTINYNQRGKGKRKKGKREKREGKKRQTEGKANHQPQAKSETITARDVL
jgi:hypothetical protein